MKVSDDIWVCSTIVVTTYSQYDLETNFLVLKIILYPLGLL